MVSEFSQKVRFVSSQSLGRGGCRQWADVGWDWREKWPLPGVDVTMVPSPRSTSIHIAWGHWPGSAGLWLPARLGHQPRFGEQDQGPRWGAWKARPLTFLTPLCPAPPPASFSVCSMTLFVFKSPGLRKPQWGVTGLGGCQWGETPSFASFSPPPSPLPWALWTPLPTPFILGLLRFRVLQPLPGLTAHSQRPAKS